jgi:hypothetical protein
MMSAKTFRSIVNNPETGKDEVENLLALLFRDILMAHSPSVDSLDRKMERYYQKVYGGDRRLVAQEKNNLSRALTRPSISWERFETLIQLLGCDKYVVRVDLTYGDKTYTSEVEVRNRYSDKRLQHVSESTRKRRRPATPKPAEPEPPEESDDE